MSTISSLMRQNFLEYASYVVMDRAIPDIRDGAKPVQRRILHTISTMDDGKFTKVANIIGECMKLHPHGDVSIGDALVVLANKGRAVGNPDLGYFIEKQGNFGNIMTGDGPAASRYIECRLTPLAKEVLFNPALTKSLPSYDGRREEPESLPAKVPVILMLGTEGIAVGMATTILPHNFGELIQAQIRYLKGEAYRALRPDFPTGGILDASQYDDGLGSVKVRAKIEADGEKRVVITELPWGKTTESLMESIETAVGKGKVKIGEILDKTGEEVRIELNLPRGVTTDEVIPQLFAFTDCEVEVNSNIVVIRDRKPAEIGVREILEYCAERLKEIIKAELEHLLANLLDKQHWLTLEQLFIENRVYKKIESQTTEDGVNDAVWKGMEQFKTQFVRDMVDADVARLLEIRIKRISQFDINKNRKDIDDIVKQIKEAKSKLKDLVGTTVSWLEYLHDKYAKFFPRRTKVKAMEEIDQKSVARANLRMGYDQATGFFGKSVKVYDREIKCSEYDKVIAIMNNGVYRIMAPTDKILLEGKLIYLDLFDADKGIDLVVIYRDKEKIPWAKKVQIKAFIKDREYELIKDGAGKIDHLLFGNAGTKGVVTSQMVPAPRLRVTEETFDLKTLEPCGMAARGTRIAERATAKTLVSRE
jgi:topoisomerase IV subunit A